MKGLLTAFEDNTPVLTWDSIHMIVGNVLEVADTKIIMEPLLFQRYRGFVTDSKGSPFDVHVPDLKDRSLKPRFGCQITCYGRGQFDKTNRSILYAEDSVLIHRPEFSTDFGWEAAHLFCGAFGGWTQALKRLPKTTLGVTVGREMFLDHDADVMECWERKYDEKCITLPTTKVRIWDASDTAGFLGPVADKSWLHHMFTQINLLCTASPPCVSWSKGGLAKGLQCSEGWAFIEAIEAAFCSQACILTFECADDFQPHPQAKLVLGVLSLLGFRRIWDQVVTLHNMADMYRNRWLSAWSRCDVSACPVDACFTPRVSTKASWTSFEYDFDLPESMLHQLALSPSEINKYASPDLLPPSKRKLGQTDPNHALQMRFADPKAPLPTLCASYSTQHCLSPQHISKKGIFGCLIQENKKIYFIDPPRWISLLGSCEKLVLPSKLSSTFKLVGNAVAVPHALLALLIAFQATHKQPIAISAELQACWNDRLTAPTALILAGADFWTLVSLREFLSNVKAGQPSGFDSQTMINLLITPRGHHAASQLKIPAQWSFKRLVLEALGIDYHAARTVNCGNINRRIGSDTTLQHMAALDVEWEIMVKSIEAATITFHGLSFPTEHHTSEAPTHKASHHLLPIPTFDHTLTTPTFQRFLGILEDFYVNTEIRTQDDAKQTVHMGFTDPDFVTRIPLRKGNQFEQVRHIGRILFPDEPARQIKIAPVPLTSMPQYPLYLMCRDNSQEEKISIFVEEHKNQACIYTTKMQRHITSDDTFHLHNRTYKLLYHNAAFLGEGKHVKLCTADIITLTEHNTPEHNNTRSNIVAGGHHTHQTPPILVGPSQFIDRIEFGVNTNGWLASDELTFALDFLEQNKGTYGKNAGIGIWCPDTSDILPLHHVDFQITDNSNHLLPLLVGSHWVGLRIGLMGNNATLQITGLQRDLIHPVVAAVARILDLTPQVIHTQVTHIPDIPHMCGWQILH